MQASNSSGSQEDKKSRKQKAEAEKARKKDAKRKAKFNMRDSQRRRTSVDRPLRYRLSFRPDGPQPSHSVRNLVPRLSDENKKVPLSIPRIVPSLTSLHSKPEREHNADFFNRISPFFSTKESLINVSRPAKQKESWFRLHRTPQAKINVVHRSFHHPERCKACMHLIDDCVCMSISTKPLKSDWAVLVQPITEQPRRSVNRLDWLVEIEDQSAVDKSTMLEEKFDENREICCFPFNTFQIFSKRDIKQANFYLDN